MRGLLSCILLATLAGCANLPSHKAYAGPDLPPSKTARISGFAQSKFELGSAVKHVVLITCVDGVSTEQVPTLAHHNFPQDAVVLPGRHYVAFMTAHDNKYASASFWFDAEAGRHYSIQRKPEGKEMVFWIEDDATRRKVGGTTGSEPNPAPSNKNCALHLYQAPG